MYYKVMHKGHVIDVLKDVEVVYLKYQERYGRMVFCDYDEAQGIFSSDRTRIWHVDGLYDIPVPGYDTVELEEIDGIEYDQLKIYKLRTPDEIIDCYTLALIEDGVI